MSRPGSEARLRYGLKGPSAGLYVVALLALCQFAISAVVPVSLVYNYRMDYIVVKDNLANVGATLDLLARDIKEKGLTDYLLLLGDSVAYSGPGGPSQSLSRFMNDVASSEALPPVYNLAIPAAQMGDFYTMLLMLDERGISTDHVALNLIYAGFVARDPDPPIVYWLERELQRLDPAAYLEVAGDLARSQENKDRPTRFESFLEYEVYSRIPVLKYRDFARAVIERRLGAQNQETGDPRAWFEKPYLKDALTGPVYERLFDPTPLRLDSSNLNVTFLSRIMDHQNDKDLLLYMSPLNKTLMSEETSAPGFIRSMASLNEFLDDMACERGFTYVDLSDAVPHELFSDHMHLIPEGYNLLSTVLWQRIGLARWF